MLKVLMLDIETAPKVAYVWGVWDNNVYENQIAQDSFIISWSAKWEGMEAFGDVVTGWEAQNCDDSRIMKNLWEVMNEADVIVGHNSNKFDIPIINTRFIVNDIPPPSPYRKVDTLVLAKRHFKFNWNRLDYLNRTLNGDKKAPTGGMQTWIDCLKGDEKALAKMLKYNLHDVELQEKLFVKVRPYVTGLPNMSVDFDTPSCPRCGGHHLHKRGYTYTNGGRYQRLRCVDCGGWSRGRKDTRTKDEKTNTTMPISY